MPLCSCGCLRELSLQQIYNHRHGRASLNDRIFVQSTQVIQHRLLDPSQPVCDLEAEFQEFSNEYCATRLRAPATEPAPDLSHQTPNQPSTSVHLPPSPEPLPTTDTGQIQPEYPGIQPQTDPTASHGLPDWVDIHELRVQDGYMDNAVTKHDEPGNEMECGVDPWDESDLLYDRSAEDNLLEFEDVCANALQRELVDSSK